MPRASIEYMNARRALKPASGGAKQSRAVKYAPDTDRDPFDAGMSALFEFAIWAQQSRAQYLAANGTSSAELDGEPTICGSSYEYDEIPF
jgi:hypothetical protein